jgi:ATP-binding cassette, subfamily C, type I secretion system permease/ATPase
MSIVARLLIGLGQLLLACAVALSAWDAYGAYVAGTASPLTDLRLLWAWTDRSVADLLLDPPFALALAVAGAALYAIGRKGRHTMAGADEEDARVGTRDCPHVGSPHKGSELRAAFRSCRGAFVGVAVFSFIINVLMLTGAVFMLEVYDRILPSRSVPTLVAMCIIAGILYAGLGILDLLRGRLLARVGASIDERLAVRVFDAIVLLPVRIGNRGDGLQPLRDLDTVRSFLSGPGPTALLDLPWLPFYLAIVYAFHPLLGLTALAGATVLICLTLLTDGLSRAPTREATAHVTDRINLAQACHRNAEVLAGMGFASRLGVAWYSSNGRALAAQQRAGDIASGLGAIARVLRMILQSAVLAVGAYLVIMHEASGGIIIAGSILAARALAPVDIAIANWRGFVAARQSWARLGQLLAALPTMHKRMPLPAPSAKLQVDNLVVVPPGQKRVVVRDVSFALKPGQGLGIIGSSGSGKSSLARALVGAWLPTAGKVRLDGAALEQWGPEALGQHIGYLPQGVELFAGSVAQNIARFEPDASSEAVVEAAKAADVHELIVNLPNGYDTEIGEGGSTLSAGQRQRIALARALYGNPFLLVLDEPDASLDQDGEQALHKAILSVRERGGIVVVVSHRQSVLGAVDLLLVLERGRQAAAGPKQLVLQKLARPIGRAVVQAAG